MNEKIKKFVKCLKNEEKAENTIAKYLRDVREFYKWHGNKKIITKEELLEYKEYLKRINIKVTTINSKISSLNSFLSYTENEPLRLKVIKWHKSIFGTKEKELSKNEFNKLYDAAKNDKRLRLILEVIAKTGIRVSEIHYITVESLDLGKAVVNNKGKIRIVLLPRKLCKVLKDYCRGVSNVKKICKPITSGPIFITKNGKSIDRRQIWQMLKNLAKKAGISSDKVYPHNLRHLFAREFYRQTHDIVKLASILGHSSIETTMIYAKETEDRCRVEIEKLRLVRD